MLVGLDWQCSNSNTESWFIRATAYRHHRKYWAALGRQAHSKQFKLSPVQPLINKTTSRTYPGNRLVVHRFARHWVLGQVGQGICKHGQSIFHMKGFEWEERYFMWGLAMRGRSNPSVIFFSYQGSQLNRVFFCKPFVPRSWATVICSRCRGVLYRRMYNKSIWEYRHDGEAVCRWTRKCESTLLVQESARTFLGRDGVLRHELYLEAVAKAWEAKTFEKREHIFRANASRRIHTVKRSGLQCSAVHTSKTRLNRHVFMLYIYALSLTKWCTELTCWK